MFYSVGSWRVLTHWISLTAMCRVLCVGFPFLEFADDVAINWLEGTVMKAVLK